MPLQLARGLYQLSPDRGWCRENGGGIWGRGVDARTTQMIGCQGPVYVVAPGVAPGSISFKIYTHLIISLR